MAFGSDQSLNVIVRLVDNASAGLKTIGKNADDFASKVEKFQPAFGAMATSGSAAFGAIALALKKGMDEINGFQTVTQRLTKILQTSTGATDEQAQSLIDQAIALEGVGVASKESIVNMQAQLATFDLQYDTISKLTPALTDYIIAEKGANATTEDFKQLTNGMAQALNGNFASLTKTGFVLDDATKKLISTGTEMERAEAITRVLEGTYKGFNKSVTETAEGMKVLRDRGIGDLFAAISGQVGPVFEQLDKAIISITGNVTKWIEANPELTKNLILGGLAVSALVAGIGLLGLALPVIISGFGAIATTLGVLLSPIGLIVAGVAALGLAFSTNFMGFRDAVVGAWAVVSPILDQIWKGFESTFDNIMQYVELVKGPLIQIWGEIQPIIIAFLDTVGQYFSTTFANIVQIVGGAFDIIKGIFDLAFSLIGGAVTLFFQVLTGDWSGAWETIKLTTSTAWEAIKLIFSGAMEVVRGVFSQFAATLRLGFSALWTAISTATKIAFDGITNLISGAFTAIGEFFRLGADALSKVWGGFTAGLGSAMTTAWEGIKTTIANGINWVIDKINAAIALINAATGKVGGPQIPLVGRVAFQDGGIVPAFQDGGMVGGGSRVPGHHDLVPAMLDPGELILNRAQQRNVAEQLITGSQPVSTPSIVIQVTGNSFYGSSSDFADQIGDTILEKFKVHMSVPSY